MDLQKFGGLTPQAVIQRSESHKLGVALEVASGKTVKAGQPVIILDNGTVRAFETGDSSRRIIGYAVDNSNIPAYVPSKQHGPVDITVSCKGYAVLYGVASGAVTAGPVALVQGMDASSRYQKYADEADNATTQPTAISLDSASDGELIRILFL